MFVGLIKRYCVMFIFSGSLLVGVQLPHFLFQYEQRLDARYLEASEQLVKYQSLADLFFGGSLPALLKKHQASDVELFKAEADILAQLISRVDFLAHQKVALDGHLFSRLLFLINEINQPLFLETQSHYQANITLNKDALIVGLLFAVIFTLLIELFFNILKIVIKQSFVFFIAKWQTRKIDNRN